MDKLISQHGCPKFCKIDVEGYEPQVLAGLFTRIPVITIEYHSDDKCTEIARQCITMLSRFGSLEINATGEDGNALLFPRWYDKEAFLSDFPSCVAPHPYGDLIIRTG